MPLRRPATTAGRRRLGAFLAMLALAVIGAAAYLGVVALQSSGHEAHDCRLIRAQLRHTASERAALSQGSGPTVAFLGDSYAQGLELPDIRNSYVYVVTAAEHWRPVVNGFGGSGYVNGSSCHHEQLLAREPAVVRSHPSIVIVQAGLNDVSYPPRAVEQAARLVFAALRRDLPAARLVTVGPHPTPGLPHVDATIGAIRAAAASEHVQFIDTRLWPLQFGVDREHLTVRGNYEYGLLLVRALNTQRR